MASFSFDDSIYYTISEPQKGSIFLFGSDDTSSVWRGCPFVLFDQKNTSFAHFRFTGLGTSNVQIRCRRTGGLINAAAQQAYDYADHPPGWKILPGVPQTGFDPSQCVQFVNPDGLYLGTLALNNWWTLVATTTPTTWIVSPAPDATVPVTAISPVSLQHRSLQDYAIQGAFALGGSILGLAVPGGSAAMTAAYNLAFPSQDMGKVLTTLYNDIKAGMAGDLAQVEVGSAIEDLHDAMTSFHGSYVLSRQTAIQSSGDVVTGFSAAANVAAVLRGTLDAPLSKIDPALNLQRHFHTEEGLSFFGPPKSITTELPITCDLNSLIAQNLIMRGLPTYAAAVTLRWAVWQEQVWLLSHAEGTSRERSGDGYKPKTDLVKVALNLMKKEVAADQAAISIMFDYALQERLASVVCTYDANGWNFAEQRVPGIGTQYGFCKDAETLPFFNLQEADLQWSSYKLSPQIGAKFLKDELPFEFQNALLRQKRLTWQDTFDLIMNRTVSRSDQLRDPANTEARATYEQELADQARDL